MRVLITGASRGIGAAVARTFAKRHGEECTVVLLARTLRADAAGAPSLLQVAEDVERHGARAVPVQADVRNPAEVKAAAHLLDGLDVLVNNASALYAAPALPPRRMDLLYEVNTRATMLCMEACRPLLEASRGAIVTLAPSVRIGRLDWIAAHPAYTISKYSMSLATLAHASDRVRANCLWPRHTVATAATRRIEENGWIPDAYTLGRPPDDFADAVHALATSSQYNARTLYDDEVVEMPPTRAPLDAFATPRLLHPLYG